VGLGSGQVELCYADALFGGAGGAAVGAAFGGGDFLWHGMEYNKVGIGNGDF
jgi:hypothetical protein